MKHATPLIRRQGGSIISTASVAGMLGGYSPHAYAAAKAAVIQLTKSVALELAEARIRVNCICPGFIATPLALNTVGKPESELESRKSWMSNAQPIERPGEPRDSAEMALFSHQRSIGLRDRRRLSSTAAFNQVAPDANSLIGSRLRVHSRSIGRAVLFCRSVAAVSRTGRSHVRRVTHDTLANLIQVARRTGLSHRLRLTIKTAEA
jgi:hypothetical protein